MPRVIDEYSKPIRHGRDAKMGDIYRHENGDYYIVASADNFDSPEHYRTLISLYDGNRWTDAIPKKDFKVPEYFEYVENPELIIRRSV